jgi:Cys-rich protein (TIGR01571 family)
MLALAAGYCVYTVLHTPEVEGAISHALAEQPVPADMLPAALAAARIAPAVIAVLIVLVLGGILEASAFCCCGRMSASGSQRQEHVPMGIPVTYSTPYTEMASAAHPMSHASAGTGAWADGLCGCFNDLKLLAVGLCCPCIVPAQLFQRVKRQPYSCFLIVGLFAVASLFASGAQSGCPNAGPKVLCTTSGGSVRCDAHPAPQASSSQHVPAYCALVDGTSSLTWLMLVALVMTVRAAVRAAHSIPPSCCGECDDCCAAFCCLPLTACQIMRHLGHHERTEYRLASTTGEAATAV